MKILGARLHSVLRVHRQMSWRSSKMMWHSYKSFLKFALLSSYAFGFLMLLTSQVVGPTFVLVIWTFVERLWFLSSGLCSLGQRLFALPCHERDAQQMGPLALLVLLHLCLANVNRWWWLLPWEERWVPLAFTVLNSYSLLKKRLQGYGAKELLVQPS